MKYVDEFQINQVWESPKGLRYVVEAIGPERTAAELASGKRKQATLRKLAQGKSRRIYRDYDAVCGWVRIK